MKSFCFTVALSAALLPAISSGAHAQIVLNLITQVDLSATASASTSPSYYRQQHFCGSMEWLDGVGGRLQSRRNRNPNGNRLRLQCPDNSFARHLLWLIAYQQFTRDHKSCRQRKHACGGLRQWKWQRRLGALLRSNDECP